LGVVAVLFATPKLKHGKSSTRRGRKTTAPPADWPEHNRKGSSMAYARYF